jgi:hypothetical protein
MDLVSEDGIVSKLSDLKHLYIGTMAKQNQSFATDRAESPRAA